jgi:UPF0042 nucleotide-binding protein
LIVLTGLSGSGKTVALHALEDQDFYCVDNLPAGLLQEFARTITCNEPGEEGAFIQVAVGIDARNRQSDLRKLPAVIKQLREDPDIHCQVFYLQADDEQLIARFSETRRRHPLAHDDRYSLQEAIQAERRMLEPMASLADLFLDSSQCNVHELRRQVLQRVGASNDRMSVMVESFGYKRGIPVDVDFAFDVRCLPNPHWDEVLRPFTGKDAPVAEFLAAQPLVQAMYADLQGFVDRWLPAFEAENRSYVTIGVGCTGGRHRSVYLAERLAEHLRGQRGEVLLHHRELDREQAKES